MGTTPFAYAIDARRGKVELVVKQRAYEDFTILVPADRDSDQRVTLVKAVKRSAPAPSAADAGSAHKPRSNDGSLDPFEKLDRKQREERP